MEAQAKDAMRRLFGRASFTKWLPLPSDSNLQVGPLQEDTNGNKFYPVTDLRNIEDMEPATWRFYPPDKDGVLLVMAILKDSRYLQGHSAAYIIDDPAPLLRRKVRFAETVIPDVDAFVARVWRRDVSEVDHGQAKHAVRRLTRLLLVPYPAPSDSELQVGEPQEDKAGNKFCPVMDLRCLPSDIPSVSWRFYPPNDDGVLMAAGLWEIAPGEQVVSLEVEDPHPLMVPGTIPHPNMFPARGLDPDKLIASLWHREVILQGDWY